MPAHCEPWPGKTNTVRPGSPATPRDQLWRGRVLGNARRPSMQRSRSLTEEHGPVAERGAAGEQRAADVVGVQVRGGRHEFTELPARSCRA